MNICSRSAWALSVLLALLPPMAGAAPALDLHEAVSTALARDTGLQSLEARSQAAMARGRADGALPDPELSVGYQGLPVDSFSTSAEMMTMLMVVARQRFPAGSTRHLQRSRGELEAEVLLAERDGHALDIRRAVRGAWLDWRYAGEAEALTRAAEDRLTELLEITQRRFETGSAGRQDVARARLERAVLIERRIDWAAREQAAAADLSRWLGEGVTTPGAGPNWPAPDAQRLAERVPEHPALRNAAMREALGDLGSDLAREAYKPTWMVEVGYGFRRGRDPFSGDSRSDMFSGMVSVSVPLFTANRQDERLRAAIQEREAARFDQTDLLREFMGRQERQLALHERYAELVALYEDELLPAAVDTRSAMFDAYRNDRATFDEVIRAQLDELEHGLGALRAARRRDDAHLELRYLEGE